MDWSKESQYMLWNRCWEAIGALDRPNHINKYSNCLLEFIVIMLVTEIVL